MDIRDLSYDLKRWTELGGPDPLGQNRKEKKALQVQMSLDLIGVIPVIGAIKGISDVDKLGKYSDDIATIGKYRNKVDNYTTLIPELKYGKSGSALGIGFDSFSDAKKYLGSAGEGNQWHHIVEQSHIKKSGFNTQLIQNTDNLIAVDKIIHAKISGYYDTKSFDFSGGLSV